MAQQHKSPDPAPKLTPAHPSNEPKGADVSTHPHTHTDPVHRHPDAPPDPEPVRMPEPKTPESTRPPREVTPTTDPNAPVYLGKPADVEHPTSGKVEPRVIPPYNVPEAVKQLNLGDPLALEREGMEGVRLTVRRLAELFQRRKGVAAHGHADDLCASIAKNLEQVGQQLEELERRQVAQSQQPVKRK